MAWKSLGGVVVTTGGTPVQITTEAIKAGIISVQGDHTNAGDTYFGLTGIVRATLVGAIFTLPLGSHLPVMLGPTLGPNPFVLNQFFVDADSDGEIVLISYFEY